MSSLLILTNNWYINLSMYMQTSQEMLGCKIQVGL